MKNILKYTAAAALVVSLASCQEFEDYTQTVGGASKLVYVNAGTDNFFSARVVHRPEASTGEFSTEFGVSCNTPVHGAVKVSLVYDASLVERYNTQNKTAYAVLPEEYFVLENGTLTLAENANRTEEKVKVALAADADFTQLTERYYLAPLRLKAEGLSVSEELGAVYLAVETENNIIRPITKLDDMVGFPALGRSSWLADCNAFRNLFDGNTSTWCDLDKQKGNVVVIDMQEPQLVTGFCIGASDGMISIEYSLDGETYEQAGTPVKGEYVTSSSQMYIALENHIEAQYIRLRADFTLASSKRLTEFNIYKVDSAEPTVYAMTGTDNVVITKIVHKKGVGSTCALDAAFKAYVTAASQSGYSVTFVSDDALVEAYNTANKTSYAALPAANLKVENAPLAIAAGERVSTADAKLSLTGDLSTLNNKEGYLAALKLSAQGAGTSENRGVIYVVVKIENNLIRAIRSVDDMVGFPAAGRSSWGADCSDAANLFDNNNATTASGLAASDNVLTVDMSKSHMVTGLHFYAHSIKDLSIEYSLDGVTFDTAGTVASGENVFTGTSSNAGNYYVAFADYLEARYMRVRFGFTSTSSSRRSFYEFAAYVIESADPTIYAQCGTDNVLTGSIVHHTIAGSNGSLNGGFNVYTTVSSASGYSVTATLDQTLVAAYNQAHGTSYEALPAANLQLDGSPCVIAGGANKSAGQIKASLKGDLSGLTNTKGYLAAVKLSTPGAVTSASRGVVYFKIEVSTSSELFRKNFAVSDITGTLVADRSAWTIIAFDKEGLYPYDYDGKTPYNPSYDKLLDGDESTYVRTWGGPISFTVDLGKEYDMTGMMFASSAGYSTKYAPNSVMIEYSLDGVSYTELGTPTQTAGSILVALPKSYIALYGSQKVRYLKILASYSNNMGTGEFNIYAK